MKKLNLLYYIGIFLLILLNGACQNELTSATETVAQVTESVTEAVSINENTTSTEITSSNSENDGTETTLTEADTETQTATEMTPAYTPTPDLRLKPEQWREWPVIPVVSPNTVSIYKKGIALGNDPKHFSKIGDCQSIKEVLLGIYDLPGRYTLSVDDQYLQATIDNYAGSFNRDGMAVRGGFNAATVLSPIWSDPEYCDAGENPIQCEYRVHQPAMVIISLEVWWDGRSPERYEQYMRRIIEYSIEQGVVPVLSTKADNVEGDHSINYTTAKLAYEYDIPLWNFWLAVQNLPNQGIDPDRDGFHISVDAWNVRSYTALQTIYAISQAATDSSEVGDEPVIENEEPVLKPVVSMLVFHNTEIPAYDMDGTIFFELTETIDGEVLPAGIYQLTLSAGDLIQLFPAGATIISENFEHGFIVSTVEEYYFINKYGAKQRISGYDFSGKRVIMIGQDEFLIYETNSNYPLSPAYGVIDGSGNVSVAFFDIKAVPGQISTIYTATKDFIVVSVGDCDQGCKFYTIHNYLTPDEVSFREMDGFDDPLIHSESGMMAFWRNFNGVDSLYLLNLANPTAEQYLGLYGNVLLDQAWKHDSSTLAAIKMERSDYYGRATDILHFVIDGNTNILKEYSSLNGLNPRIAWSPDDQFLITSITQMDDQGNSTILLRIINTFSGQEALLDSDLGMESETYIAIKNLIWFN